VNSGLLNGLTATAPRTSLAVLTRRQTLSSARQTQAMANLGSGRASLSADVTRTDTTLSNTGLSALDVPLLANSRYRITYRIYISCSGTGGWQWAHTWPASPTKLSAFLSNMLNQAGTTLTENFGWNDYIAGDQSPLAGTASGDAQVLAAYDSVSGDSAVYEIAFDISTAAGGPFKLLLAQNSDNGTTTFTRNCCVEWQKF